MAEQSAAKPDWRQQLADLPVIGGVLDAFVTYFRGTWLIARQPLNFIDRLELASRPDLSKASKFLVAGIVISYLLNTPVFIAWGADVSQAIFLVDRLAKALVAFCIIHATMRMFGSKAGFGSTCAIFSYSSGLFYPIATIFYLPLNMLVGPALLNADFTSMRDPRLMAALDRAMGTELVIVSVVTLLALSVACSVLQVMWFRRLYGLGLARTLTGIVIGIVAAILLGSFIVAPVLARAEGLLAEIVQFL